jgi:nicotinamidase-related amidase
MQALVVVDAQNEFSAVGLRAVPNHAEALKSIRHRVAEARQSGGPIAWIRHYNKRNESPAFVPGTWGAELSSGLGPRPGFGPEKLFEKDVYGAFTGTDLERWLREIGTHGVLLVGFYTHMCVSTSAREALVRGFDVAIDPDGTGARGLDHELLGHQSAEEVRCSALLHLVNMGVAIERRTGTGQEVEATGVTRGSDSLLIPS